MRTNNPTKIVVHHTAVRRSTNPKQFYAVNNYHREQFGDYCKSSMGYWGGYTIFIDGDGSEWRYREDNEEGCHTKGQNTTSLGVCLAGHFDYEYPTAEQLETLKQRLKKWTDKYNIADIEVYPHRHFANYKTCYGSLLSDTWARDLVRTPVAVPPTDKEKEIKELSSKLDAIKAAILRIQIILASIGKNRA
jgi:hypothetical protein